LSFLQDSREHPGLEAIDIGSRAAARRDGGNAGNCQALDRIGPLTAFYRFKLSPVKTTR